MLGLGIYRDKENIDYVTDSAKSAYTKWRQTLWLRATICCQIPCLRAKSTYTISCEISLAVHATTLLKSLCIVTDCFQYNVARCVVLFEKTDHITPHLRTLHWLPVHARIEYKLCSLCFGAITSAGPVYLSDLLKIYTPSRQLRSSADIRILCIPSVNTKSYGERSFSCTGPTLWNTFRKDIRFSVSFFL